MKRYTHSFILFLASLAILVSACGSHKNEKTTTGDQQVITVKPYQLQKDTIVQRILLPGELKAFQEVDLYAKLNSFVKEIPVDRGTKVYKGEVLAILDAPELQSQLSETAGRLSAKEAAYRASRSTYRRLSEASRTPGAVSPNDLETALSRMESDSSEWNSAMSAYKAIKNMESYLTITAPFDGVITERNVHPGAFVGPSGKGSELPILRLVEQDRLRLVVAVPEIYSAEVKLNTQIDFTVNALEGKNFSSTITRISGGLDQHIRSEMIEMDINNTSNELLPGMYAHVGIRLSNNARSWVVPKTALVPSTEKLFVIKIVNGKASRVEVNKGNETSDMVEVFGNLNRNDRIVADASESIREGQALDTK
jgi:RND family efflux transporter MFP subunit